MINDSLIVSLLQDKHEIEVEIAAHLQYVVLLRTKWLAMCRLACVVSCKRRHRYEHHHSATTRTISHYILLFVIIIREGEALFVHAIAVCLCDVRRTTTISNFSLTVALSLVRTFDIPALAAIAKRTLCMRYHEKDKYTKIDKINLCALICWEFSTRAQRRNVILRKSFSFLISPLTTRNPSCALIKIAGVGVRSLFFFGQVKSSHPHSCEMPTIPIFFGGGLVGGDDNYCVYSRDCRIKLSGATSMNSRVGWMHSIVFFIRRIRSQLTSDDRR